MCVCACEECVCVGGGGGGGGGAHERGKEELEVGVAGGGLLNELYLPVYQDRISSIN